MGWFSKTMTCPNDEKMQPLVTFDDYEERFPKRLKVSKEQLSTRTFGSIVFGEPQGKGKAAHRQKIPPVRHFLH